MHVIVHAWLCKCHVNHACMVVPAEHASKNACVKTIRSTSQTDRWTTYHNITALCTALRGKKHVGNVRSVHDCVSAIGDWCASRRLQVNPSKTEMIWFGSRGRLQLTTCRYKLAVTSLHQWTLCVTSGLDLLSTLSSQYQCNSKSTKSPVPAFSDQTSEAGSTARRT